MIIAGIANIEWYVNYQQIKSKASIPPNSVYIYINGSIDINHPFLDTYDTLTCQTMCIYIFNTESLKSI